MQQFALDILRDIVNESELMDGIGQPAALQIAVTKDDPPIVIVKHCDFKYKVGDEGCSKATTDKGGSGGRNISKTYILESDYPGGKERKQDNDRKIKWQFIIDRVRQD